MNDLILYDLAVILYQHYQDQVGDEFDEFVDCLTFKINPDNIQEVTCKYCDEDTIATINIHEVTLK